MYLNSTLALAIIGNEPIRLSRGIQRVLAIA
jgi:hypothetical protein